MAFLRASTVPLCLVTAVAATLAMSQARTHAATFVWGGGTGAWTSGPSWQGGSAPPGTNTTDVLTFRGDVGTPYTATNNFGSPFLLNRLVLEASGSIGNHFLAADASSSIVLAGSAPQILQSGTGGFNVTAPIELRANTTFAGNGTGVVTLNGAISGAFDITKTGTSTFRFGSLLGDNDPSGNKWMGTLNLEGGTIRFNNNASTGRTALRGNPIVTSSGTVLTASSELRAGTLSGTGAVTTTVEGVDIPSNSIVVHALQDGTFSGALAIGAPTGTGKSDGSLVVRGTSTQRFNGTVALSSGDVVVGHGATMILSGTATLGNEAKGAVVLNGGTFILDNVTGGNNNNRLRGTSADFDSTGLETIGGGKFSLVGSPGGTQETMARLQLGSVKDSGLESTARSGALNINIVHNAGAAAATTLTFAAYTRNGVTTTPSARQYATVNFSAENGSGTALALGQAGSNPRIFFSGIGFTMPLSGVAGTGLLSSTGGAADVGWATINGSDFASYDSTNGIVAATTTGFPMTGAGNAAANYLLTAPTSNVFLTQNFSAQSLKIAPAVANRSLVLGSLNLTTQGYLLSGDTDFSITSTSGSIAGDSSRYFYIDKAKLGISARIGGSGAIVKSGNGTLELTNTNNASNNSALVINQGQVRASISSLPGGELRFRGGVLEITGGGTFNRPVGNNSGNVNWNGFDGFAPVNQDRGSGGFAAVGADVTLDLGGAAQTLFTWETNSFVNSGHALIFGSPAATHKVNWVDNLNLTAAGTINYNAREIRVVDNLDPAITTDRLQISGAISGSTYNDLLKTGDGVLELSGTNTYAGATIVHQGTLLVNGDNSEAFLTHVKSGARLGGTGKVRTTRVEAGGILAPGEISGSTRTGQLQVNGDLFFGGSTSKLEIEIALGAHDSVEVNGGVSLDGAELVGSLLNGFLAAPLDLFFLIINDGNDAVQGTFAQGSLVNIGGQGFEISYNGNYIEGGGTFTGGNDVVLRAVPEPSAGLLTGAAALLLGGMRRLRQRRAVA